MNGQIIVQDLASPNWPATTLKLLHTNFYSYTTPDAPFVNHHWLSGVMFYGVWKLGGFTGLGFLSLLVNTVTFVLFFRLGIKRGGFLAAAAVAALLIPLAAERTEIRPEIFSYLLSGVYLTILNGVSEGEYKRRTLWLLVPLQCLWINLHIYFFLGFAYIAVYWIHALIKKNTLAKPIFFSGIGAAFFTLLNPSILYGLFYPFFIFTNYAIKTYENQSVLALDILGKTHPNFLLLQLSTAVLIICYTHLLLRSPRLLHLPETVLSILVGIWAYLAIRNLGIFGFLALFTLPAVLKAATDRTVNKTLPLQWRVGIIVSCLVFSSVISFSRLEYLSFNSHFGLAPNSTAVADFINSNNIEGPMFNDFDIGSYAIFFLYPRIKPFIDNRPEAFPNAFITREYTPLQTNETVWQETLKKYNFNFILYHFTKSQQVTNKFLIARLHDTAWAPVYADEFAIVLLRRTPTNQDNITTYEIPISEFKF